MLANCGLMQLFYLPQLFYRLENGSVVLLVIKLVDDVLIGGDDSRRAHLIDKMKRSFEDGTVSHTPVFSYIWGHNDAN